MCGIAGKVCWGAHVDSAALGGLMSAMLAALAHRGPDDRATHVAVENDCAVGLAHARLSIIDLSPSGRQPMTNEDGTLWLVCNGEIYNYKSLARELKVLGHRFTSRSDSEVILHGYEEWGRGVLSRLEGMFAFALWDGPRRTLLCARDPVGIKPLYWCVRQQSLWFGSELKALLADPAVPRAVSPAGLAHYLAFGHGVAPGTMLEHIHKLLPGHVLIAADGQVRTEPYWELQVGPWSAAGREALISETRARLEAAVRSHMVADVPVGAFLSGGLDSSAIVALMDQGAGRKVATFTAGFAEPGYDERTAARLVAAHVGAEHHEVEVGPRAFSDSLGAVAWHYDEPFADPAAVPLFLLSREAVRCVKVVLTGEGSDELFAGYRRVSVERFAGAYGILPAPVRRLLSTAAGRLPGARRAKQALTALAMDDPAERYASWLTVFGEAMRSRLLLHEEAARADVLGHYRRYVNPDLDPVTRALYCDFKTWLPDTYLEKVDKATMAFGLEARVPFLDRRLVEFAFTVPPGLKIAGLDTKHILKRALRPIVPQQIRRRPKHGFAVPLEPWFRGPLREQVQAVITDTATRQRGLLRPEYLAQLARDHWSGANARHAHLYQVIMLELWCRTYLDGTPERITV